MGKGTLAGGICSKQLHSKGVWWVEGLVQAGGERCVQSHLEVVPAVAVCVLGRVQEDEQILPQVPGQGRKPGPAGRRQRQMQHLRGQTSWGLDELQREGRKGSQR